MDTDFGQHDSSRDLLFFADMSQSIDDFTEDELGGPVENFPFSTETTFDNITQALFDQVPLEREGVEQLQCRVSCKGSDGREGAMASTSRPVFDKLVEDTGKKRLSENSPVSVLSSSPPHSSAASDPGHQLGDHFSGEEFNRLPIKQQQQYQNGGVVRHLDSSDCCSSSDVLSSQTWPSCLLESSSLGSGEFGALCIPEENADGVAAPKDAERGGPTSSWMNAEGHRSLFPFTPSLSPNVLASPLQARPAQKLTNSCMQFDAHGRHPPGQGMLLESRAASFPPAGSTSSTMPVKAEVNERLFAQMQGMRAAHAHFPPAGRVMLPTPPTSLDSPPRPGQLRQHPMQRSFSSHTLSQLRAMPRSSGRFPPLDTSLLPSPGRPGMPSPTPSFSFLSNSDTIAEHSQALFHCHTQQPLRSSTLGVNPIRRVMSTGDIPMMHGGMFAHLLRQPGLCMPMISDGTSSCPPLASAMTLKCGRYSAEERRRRISRYQEKRTQRNFNKKIKYACRKTLAENRSRIKGRFAKQGEPKEEGSNNEEDGGADDEAVVFSEEDISGNDLQQLLGSKPESCSNFMTHKGEGGAIDLLEEPNAA